MKDIDRLRNELTLAQNTIRDMEKAMREYADKTGRVLDSRALEIARLRAILANPDLGDLSNEDSYRAFKEYKQAQTALLQLNDDEHGSVVEP